MTLRVSESAAPGAVSAAAAAGSHLLAIWVAPGLPEHAPARRPRPPAFDGQMREFGMAFC